METAHELFIHELGDMLDAERRLVEALSQQAEESNRDDVKKAFETHQQQTEKQVERLEEAFEILEQEPEKAECAGMKGLVEEHDNFKEEDPSPDILDVFNVGAAQKVEKYEITAYESLIELAEDMGHTKVAKLLNQNLREEQQTLKKMEALSKKVKPENSGMEEEEEDSDQGRASSRSTRRRSRRAA